MHSIKFNILLLGVMLCSSIVGAQTIDDLRSKIENFRWLEISFGDDLDEEQKDFDSTTVAFNFKECDQDSVSTIWRTMSERSRDPITDSMMWNAISCQPIYFFQERRETDYVFSTIGNFGRGMAYFWFLGDTLAITDVVDHRSETRYYQNSGPKK